MSCIWDKRETSCAALSSNNEYRVKKVTTRRVSTRFIIGIHDFEGYLHSNEWDIYSGVEKELTR